MLSGLARQTITVIEKLAEVDGVAQTRTTAHIGYFETMSAHRRSDVGATSADATDVFVQAAGYGVTWDVSPGDKVTCDGVTRSVIEVVVLRNPRNSVISHIEIAAG